MLWLLVWTLPFWCTPPPHVPTVEIVAVLSALVAVYFLLAFVTARTISQLDNACKLASPSVLGHNEPAWRRYLVVLRMQSGGTVCIHAVIDLNEAGEEQGCDLGGSLVWAAWVISGCVVGICENIWRCTCTAVRTRAQLYKQHRATKSSEIVELEGFMTVHSVPESS